MKEIREFQPREALARFCFGVFLVALVCAIPAPARSVSDGPIELMYHERAPYYITQEGGRVTGLVKLENVREPVAWESNDELGEVVNAYNEMQAQQSLVEDRFRDMALASSDYFWEMDEILQFSYFSDRFTKVTGVPQEMLLGKTREETKIPDVNEEDWQGHLDDLAAHRPVKIFEHSRTRPDGSLVWLSVNGLPIFDSEGVFTGYRGTGTDVTERRKTDMALRDSEERFRTLFEHIPISVWVEDWSAIKTMVDNLREEGAEIDGAYFRNQRQRTEELAENTLILDFNATTLDMYRAPSKEEFWSFANDFQTNDEFLMYCDTLAAFASGETRIVVSGWEETFDGEQIYVRDTVFIAGVILHPPLGIRCCV